MINTISNGVTELYTKFAFLDVETAGREPGRHEVIEIGVAFIDPVTRGLIDSFALKLKPEHMENAEPEALEINKYSDQEWKDALPQAEGLRQFAQRLRGTTPCGWNVGFDRAFLETAMNRNGITLESAEIDYTWRDIKIDFIRWTKLVGREAEFAPRFSLGSARRVFDVEIEDPHRALPDTIATWQVWQRLEEEFQKLAALVEP